MLILDTLAKFPAYLVGLLAPLVPPDGPSELGAPVVDTSDALADLELVASELDPNQLYIEKVKANGSGCVDKSKYSVAIDSDRNSFMIIYNDMKLENPNPAMDPLQSKNCTVSVRLHIPGGFQVAMASVVSRGSATLAEEVQGRAVSRYWFAGDPISGEDRVNLVGPYEDVFQYHRKIKLQSLVWSPCGEPAVFALENQLFLNATQNPEGASEIMLADTDVGFSQIVRWKLRECDS